MSLGQPPLLSMITGRLHHLAARQRVIATNVANADTAGYTPRDLRPFTPERGGALAPTTTHANHLTGPRSATRSGVATVAAPGSETTLDGNSVVLEEEMIKLAEARTDYDAAISLYQKSMGLLRMAARAPGR